MKLSRILSLLIILTLILGTPYQTFGAEGEAPKAVCETYVSFLSQLGIIDSVNSDDGAFVTRAEFAAMTVRITNTFLSDGSDITFTDCVGNVFAPEISTAKKLGLSNGTQDGIFSPDGRVGRNAAAKMVVSALGYTAEAEAFGGYPTGYLRKASDLKIFAGTGDAEDALTVGDAYAVMYNALKAKVAVVTSASDSSLQTLSVDGRNLLTENFKLKSVSGVVTTIGHRAVSPKYAGEGNIEINGMVFKVSGDFGEYLGKSVELWYDEGKNVKVIDVFPENSEVVIAGGDVVECVGDVVEVYENDRIKKYRLANAMIFVENGRAISHTDDSFIFEDGFMRLIDNDGDGRYDFVICEKPEYFVISGIDNINSIIYDENSSLRSVCLKEDTDFERIIEIDGIRSDISALSKGMSCEIMLSSDGAVCVVRASKNASLTGVVSEIGDGEITVDGKVYKLNSYFTKNGFIIKPGTKYSFVLAPNGTVSALLADSSDDIKYGFFLNYTIKRGIDPKAIIRILNDRDEKQTFELDSKIHLNGNVVDATGEQVQTALVSNSIPKYQLIRYMVQKDKVVMIDTSISDTSNWDISAVRPEDDSLVLYMNKKSVQYISGVGYGIPNVSFNSAVVFSVPKTLATDPNRKYDEDFFRVKGTSGLVNNSSYTVDAYDFDETYLPGAVVLYTETDSAAIISPSNTETSYMVKSVSDTLNPDGEETKMIRALGGGKFVKYYVEPELCAILEADNKIPNPGDVVRFSRNTSGEVNGIARDIMYDSVNHSLSVRYNHDSLAKASNAWFTYFTGYAVSGKSGFLTLRLTNTPESPATPENFMTMVASSAKYVIYNKTTGEVRSGDASSVITENYAGAGNGSLVACMCNYFSTKTVFIYTE